MKFNRILLASVIKTFDHYTAPAIKEKKNGKTFKIYTNR